MLLINFSHPLNEVQLRRIAELIGKDVERLLERPIQIDVTAPVVDQVRTLVDAVGLSPRRVANHAAADCPPGVEPGRLRAAGGTARSVRLLSAAGSHRPQCEHRPAGL